MTAALDGLVALDLATYIAAPFCCTLLGEFGAEVIKIEQPGRGDDLRRLGHKPAEDVSYMWLVESRNKKSITCNLREPVGRGRTFSAGLRQRSVREAGPPLRPWVN